MYLAIETGLCSPDMAFISSKLNLLSKVTGLKRFRQKVALSLISGFLMFAGSVLYMSSSYTLGIEDEIYGKLLFVRQHMLPLSPKITRDFVFINTGRDLSLVEDTAAYGNIAVSDREKLTRFLQATRLGGGRPLATVIDLQFYYPYTVSLQTDSLLEQEIKHAHAFIPAIINDSKVSAPLYHADIGLAGYTTYSNNINKFKITGNGPLETLPVKVLKSTSPVKIKKYGPLLFVDGHFSLNAVWINYYLTQKSLAQKNYYNLGEIALDMEANPQKTSFLNNKIVVVGDFDHDVHPTPVGEISGSLILANIYLSLLNHQEYINNLWMVMMFGVFSWLSYYSWFKPLPKINMSLKFMFSKNLEKMVLKYFSYFGVMLLVTVISVFVFHMFVSLLFPALIFTSINYLSQKKYKSHED